MIYLGKKNGTVVHHVNIAAMKQLDGIEPGKSVTEEEWEAAGSIAHIDAFGEIILGEPEDMKAVKNEINSLSAEEAALQSELDSKDYKVIKASETGQILVDAEPEVHQRRQWCRNRINEIRLRLSELNNVV